VFKQTISVIALSMIFGLCAPVVSVADGLAGSYLAGRRANNDFDFGAATHYFSRALARDPSNTYLLENAVLAFVGNGQVQRAVPIARRLHDINEKSQIANMVLLADTVLQGDFDKAGDLLTSGEIVGPLVDGLAAAWVQVGQGRMAEALASFDQVSTGNGLETFGIYHKALALAMAGDMEGADDIMSGRTGVRLPLIRRSLIVHIEILSQLERNADAIDLIKTVFGDNLDPGLNAIRAKLIADETLPFSSVQNASEGLAEVFYTVAGALNGEADDAYTLIYTRMAEYLRADHVDAILLSANLLENLKRFDLATEAYDRIPRDDPGFHAAELGRADALRLAGNTDAAIEVLSQLSETMPDQADAHIALGDLLRQLDRFDEATRAYDSAIALYTTSDASQWVVFFTRGITFERTDDWPKAESDFRTALKLQPDQPQVLNYLGYSLVEMKLNLPEALEMIETAVAARPNDGFITDSLGWVLYRLGRYDEAVTQMERAVELEPVDPIVTDHLGDVYWAVGRVREAEFQWYRALSFEPEDTDATRIRRKLDVGLDAVLLEEGGDPIQVSDGG
jgi:tetratricopeptide (TPR) repeat protein